MPDEAGEKLARRQSDNPLGFVSAVPSFSRESEDHTMLYWAAVFFVIAIVAAIFGFGGIAAGAASIAKILFVIFLVLAVVSLIFGRRRLT